MVIFFCRTGSTIYSLAFACGCLMRPPIFDGFLPRLLRLRLISRRGASSRLHTIPSDEYHMESPYFFCGSFILNLRLYFAFCSVTAPFGTIRLPLCPLSHGGTHIYVFPCSFRWQHESVANYLWDCWRFVGALTCATRGGPAIHTVGPNS